MAWSQSDLDALDAVIKSGTLKVSYGNGTSVEYRSMSDLIAARTMVADAVNAGAPQSMSTVAQFASGL